MVLGWSQHLVCLQSDIWFIRYILFARSISPFLIWCWDWLDVTSMRLSFLIKSLKYLIWLIKSSSLDFSLSSPGTSTWSLNIQSESITRLKLLQTWTTSENWQVVWMAIVKHIKSRNTNYSVDIDNMYEFASSHCTDFKDLRDDEDIVINREWILNKLTEEEN